MQERSNGVRIVCYLGLTLLLSCIFYTLIIATGHVGGAGGLYVTGLMWCPAAAAILTALACRLDFRALGLRWGLTRYEVAGYLIPLAYAAIAYGAVWALRLGDFPNSVTLKALATKLGWPGLNGAIVLPLYFVLLAGAGMVGSLARALGEEIGWRGFLTPHLVARFGFTGGSVLTGAIWAAWHMPILLFADYNGATPPWFSIPCFAVMVIAIAVMMSWLRLRSNSVWPAAIMHASHNLFIQGFFTPLTAARGPVTAYVIDEFGLAVPICAVLFAVAVWSRRRDVHGAALQAAA